jgi:hypothetical protein
LVDGKKFLRNVQLTLTGLHGVISKKIELYIKECFRRIQTGHRGPDGKNEITRDVKECGLRIRLDSGLEKWLQHLALLEN